MLIRIPKDLRFLWIQVPQRNRVPEWNTAIALGLRGFDRIIEDVQRFAHIFLAEGMA